MFYEKTEIWQEGEYHGRNADFKPTLSVYSLDGRVKRPAVLVFPGGGYSMTSPREAETIAMQFLSKGYQAFILNYSVKPNIHPQPLLDATRAMCMIRDNCEKWRVDPAQIAVIGFSAGAHLATSLCTHYGRNYLQDIKGMAPRKNRPDLLISCYPVITAGEYANRGSFDNLTGCNEALLDELSLEKHVHDDMPPTFIWHTFSDNAVPVQNSLLLADALAKHQIPIELHIYPCGYHGLSTANEETLKEKEEYAHIATWMPLCLEWMKIYFKLSEYDDKEYGNG